jgi:hypothetical protein
MAHTVSRQATVYRLFPALYDKRAELGGVLNTTFAGDSTKAQPSTFWQKGMRPNGCPLAAVHTQPGCVVYPLPLKLKVPQLRLPRVPLEVSLAELERTQLNSIAFSINYLPENRHSSINILRQSKLPPKLLRFLSFSSIDPEVENVIRIDPVVQTRRIALCDLHVHTHGRDKVAGEGLLQEQYLGQLRQAEGRLRSMNTAQAGDLVENLGQ